MPTIIINIIGLHHSFSFSAPNSAPKLLRGTDTGSKRLMLTYNRIDKIPNGLCLYQYMGRRIQIGKRLYSEPELPFRTLFYYCVAFNAKTSRS